MQLRRATARPILRRSLALLATVAVVSSALTAVSHESRAAGENGDQINLGRYTVTFKDDFHKLSVSAWGPASVDPAPGATRWIAHTPWNGDFGDAAFSNPQPDFPFSTSKNGLEIEARKDPDGRWRSGLLASNDPQGRGFAQDGGYFEMRAKLPAGPGVWPAFWLVGNRSSKASVEVDAMEYYGQFPHSYQVAVHVWPKDKTTAPRVQKQTISVGSNSLTKEWHTYGVLVGTKTITFYFDRRQVAEMARPTENDDPMFILMDLALGSGWPITNTPNPSRMDIQSVTVYQKSDKRAAPPG